MLEGADDAGASRSATAELDCSTNLGLHGALAELAFVCQALRLVCGDVVKLTLVWPAEVHGNVVDSGQEHEHVGLAVLGEELAAHVLVDDCRDALVGALVAVVPDHRDATTTTCDDDEVVVEEVENRLVFDDLLGLRARDDASPAAAGIFDEGHLGMHGLLGVGLFLGHEGADGLRGA